MIYLICTNLNIQLKLQSENVNLKFLKFFFVERIKFKIVIAQLPTAHRTTRFDLSEMFG